ncbi:hypothetical protein B0H16DRAFT_1539968 [Mycena metata]|uniref:Uncharacterized protein n=1 Tax=Mycena metata TaxID=1033252 RepID=A0AAD7J4E6_9AGAR|nr:hypothetical protein B0H16DRAFT_1539968 [Mycena metata]
MSAFVFAYGSFGDVLATAQIAIKVISLLRNCAKRSEECVETEKEVKALGGDLANLTRIPLDDTLEASPLTQSIADRIQEEVRRCHLIMVRLFAKMNKPSGIFQRVVWATSEERELASFRMRIIERRTALGVVVGMLNSSLLLAVQDRVEDQIRDTVQSGVNGLAQQLAIYQQQIMSVVCQVSRGVVKSLFVVISPTGVSIPVPLAYCRTYSDLTRILNAYFEREADRPHPPYWLITSGTTFVCEYEFQNGETDTLYPYATFPMRVSPSAIEVEQSKIWSASLCARCGGPLATRQPLDHQVGFHSRCESVAQLVDKNSFAEFHSCVLIT